MKNSTPVSLTTNIPVPDDKFRALEQWRKMALDRFNSSPSYSELHSFYEGYGAALEDALGILKPEEVVEKSHRLFKLAVVATVAIGGVVLYERYKNGVAPFHKGRND